MNTDLTFALLFSYMEGEEAALQMMKGLLSGSVQVRGALTYKKYVLNFEDNPLRGEEGEHDFQISAFPALEADLHLLHEVFHDVYGALRSFVADIEVLVENDPR